MRTDVIATGVDGQLVLRRVRVRVTEGPDRGLELELDRGTVIVGKGVAADLRVSDRKTSRAHVELVLLDTGVRVRDLGSTNGTIFRGARLEGALTLRPPFELAIGENLVQVSTADTPLLDPPVHRVPLPLGPSAAARAVRETLGRIADRRAPACILGPAGVGKSATAQALIEATAARPIVRVMLAPSLERVELAAAIERAVSGALLIEDLHAGNAAQLEALRTALDEREAGRMPLWPIATSSVDPRELVEQGRLPRSLFFQLATVRVVLPSLAERPEDAHEVADAIALELGAPRELAARAVSELAPEGFPDEAWGLRSAIAESMTVGATDTLPDDSSLLPYKEAKARMLERFTERYVRDLLERHDGNVSRAADEAGIARQHLSALARRYGVER